MADLMLMVNAEQRALAGFLDTLPADLAMVGRPAALTDCAGEGVDLLRSRGSR